MVKAGLARRRRWCVRQGQRRWTWWSSGAQPGDSTRRTRQAGGSSPAQKRTEARWRGATLTGDRARREWGDVGSTSMECTTPDTDTEERRRSALAPATSVWLRTGQARTGARIRRIALSGPSFSRTRGDRGCHPARPIRAGRVAA
jgi:hypothetical protein